MTSAPLDTQNDGRPQRLPLSVAIITRDEALMLPDCLASVSFASEVIVVDSGSTDGTVELAKQLGATVFHEAWQGFGRQKQLAIDRCHEPWVLVLDADERVSMELAREIGQVIGGSTATAAYSVPRKNLFCGRWLRHAGWWPDRVVRLFKRGTARMDERLVHEALVVEGSVAALTSPLIHHTNRDLSQTLAKINHYSSAGAEELFRRGARASVATALGHGLWALANNYLFRLGMLDGGPGLVQALADAVNTMFKYLKLWEMGRSGSGRSPEEGR